jgi:hypothetical protein
VQRFVDVAAEFDDIPRLLSPEDIVAVLPSAARMFTPANLRAACDRAAMAYMRDPSVELSAVVIEITTYTVNPGYDVSNDCTAAVRIPSKSCYKDIINIG